MVALSAAYQKGPLKMRMLYDLFPLLLFFIAYKFFDIYVATGVAIVASLVQVLYHRIRFKEFEMMQIITCAIILIFGTMTLLLHNEIFIKWKPSVINWLFALVFFGTNFFGKQSLIKIILSKKVSMPEAVWQRLNTMWITFFLFVGFANLFVIYHFSTDTWVNFKVFGILGLTLVFGIIQAVYISKHAQFAMEESK